MARCKALRLAPRESLFVWQCLSLAAVVSALAMAPAGIAVTTLPAWATLLALTCSGAMLARLLWSGHRTGTRLRAGRRRHLTLVDALGTHAGADVRVLDHPTPTAYCLPGLRHRVVLTQGALRVLPPDQLDAVLAHERAHLRGRHDLVLEFFQVLHGAVPSWLRAPGALREVRLLVEVLADRSARREAGPVALAHALVTLARSRHPDAALAAGDDSVATRDRMRLLSEPEAGAPLRLALVAFGAAVLLAPVALLAVALG